MIVDLCLKVTEDRRKVREYAPALREVIALSASCAVTSEEVDEVVVDFSLRCIPVNRHFHPSKGNFWCSACVFIDVHVLADVLRKCLAQVDRIRARSSHGHGRQEEPSLYGDSAGR